MALPINLATVQTTIANGTALSAEVDMGADTLVGITMPAAWTAAALTFQVSTDGGVTFNEMNSSAGSAVSFTVAASQYIAVDPTLWRGVNAVKVRSGTSGTPVNQGADRVLTLVTRPLS